MIDTNPIKKRCLDLFDQKVDAKRHVVGSVICRPNGEGPVTVDNKKSIELCVLPICTLTRRNPAFCSA
jgi:hypothetical protein